jgi:hypothetical protein
MVEDRGQAKLTPPVAEDVRGIGEAMEHEQAMEQMRAHLARAGREVQSARAFMETPEGRGTNLALARALANASASLDDAMDTIQQSLSERGRS